LENPRALRFGHYCDFECLQIQIKVEQLQRFGRCRRARGSLTSQSVIRSIVAIL
jgi:hypothetical protein